AVKLMLALLFIPGLDILISERVSAQSSGTLAIVVLEGDSVKNSSGQTLDQRLAVQVQDSITGPIAGAQVVFTVPASGPGGAFPGAARSVTTTTDSQGIAAVNGFRTNGIAGGFQITVEVSYQGRTVSRTLSQTNLAGATVKKSGGSTKWIILG